MERSVCAAPHDRRDRCNVAQADGAAVDQLWVTGAGERHYSGLGIWIDLGTTCALPKYIPETNHAGGLRAVLRLLFAVLVA
ncbi:MAG: hypothetical protein ACUVSL_02875 [Chloroflexus sp.]|uniref:hypothetical protein n=1 Tax=Chloroflexus sp. TaxID=1904827 RepID=UPI0040499A3B